MTTIAPPIPDRSTDQRMSALAQANEIRRRRAELKRDLKAGRASIVALLLKPPEFVETMKVCDLLMAAPKLGRVKVNKILAGCRISPAKSLGGLTGRQRAELVGCLGRPLPHRPEAPKPLPRGENLGAYVLKAHTADDRTHLTRADWWRWDGQIVARNTQAVGPSFASEVALSRWAVEYVTEHPGCMSESQAAARFATDGSTR